MSWKQKLRNPIFQQYALELLLPIIGFFVFNWSLLLIGIYFLIDHLVSQIFFYKRSLFVREYHGAKAGIGILIISALAFLGLFFLEIVVLSTLVLHVQNITLDLLLADFWKLSKEELWYLIPLVFFAYYLKDKMTFYMSRAFVQFDFNKMVRWDLVGQFIMVSILSVSVFLWIRFFSYPSWILVTFLIGKIGFDFTLKKTIRNKSLRKAN